MSLTGHVSIAGVLEYLSQFPGLRRLAVTRFESSTIRSFRCEDSVTFRLLLSSQSSRLGLDRFIHMSRVAVLDDLFGSLLTTTAQAGRVKLVVEVARFC